MTIIGMLKLTSEFPGPNSNSSLAGKSALPVPMDKLETQAMSTQDVTMAIEEIEREGSPKPVPSPPMTSRERRDQYAASSKPQAGTPAPASSDPTAAPKEAVAPPETHLPAGATKDTVWG